MPDLPLWHCTNPDCDADPWASAEQHDCEECGAPSKAVEPVDGEE